MVQFDIIKVTPENVETYGIGCIRDKKHPGYRAKVQWFIEQYKKGLTIRIAHHQGKQAGFIEYVPGEHAWRPVQAAGYLFIHCIWVYGKEHLNIGIGSELLKHCIADARNGEYSGVAVVTSEGSWMAGNNLFKKYGFETVEKKGRFELLAHNFHSSPSPSFLDWKADTNHHRGLELIFAHQCPANAKSVNDIREIARIAGIKLNIKEITNDREAQNAPTGFGVFQLLHEGDILADHYVSGTRFKNIIKKRNIN